MKIPLAVISVLFFCCTKLFAQSSPQFGYENNLNFAASQKLLVGDILIEGNRRTKEFILRREMDIAEGDTVIFSELKQRLEFNSRRIFNTTLFINVFIKVTSSQENVIDLRITVRENWYIFGAPYFRLNDRNFNEWVDRGSDLGRLNFGAFVEHENLFGRQQKLEFVFETGFTDRFTLRYNVPYLDKGRKNGLYTEIVYQTLSNVAFNTVGNELDFVYKDNILKRDFEGKVKYRRRNGFYNFHYVELGYNRTRISDSLRTINPNYLSLGSNAQQFTSLAYTYRYDKRDNVNFTLTGRTLIFDIRKIGILPTDNFDSWQFRLSYGDYYPLGKKFYANYVLKGTLYTNPDVSYNVLRGIGYDENVLRGYDLFVVNGSGYASARFNLKREIYKNTFNLKFIKWRQFNTVPLQLFVNVFSDWGYVYNKFPERMDNSLTNTVLRSIGVGLEVSTVYNATVRFNVSQNALGQTNFFVNFQKDIWIKWN